MSIRVGRWDCPVCGTKGNLGPETKCQNCGSARPLNVRFYLPDDAEAIDDEERIREAKAGVDWVCGHCQNHNKAIHVLCTSCGNPRDELSEDIDLQEREYMEDAVPRSGPTLEEQPGEQYRRARTNPGYERKKRNPWVARILGMPIIGGIIFFLLKSFPMTVDVEVVAHRWVRAIEYSHYEEVQKEAWNTPSGAYDVQSFRAIHHYNKVFVKTETRTRDVRVKVGEEKYVCGKKDMGNGYFKDKICTRPIYETRKENYQHDVYQDVPVYQTKYRFKIKEWVNKPEYALRAGAEDHNARWPEDASRQNSNEWREGGKSQSYFISVKEDDGDVHEEQVGPQFWESHEMGSTIKAKKSRVLDIWYGLAAENKDR